MSRRLTGFAQRRLPPWAARGAKRLAVYPRYWRQRAMCRRGFAAHGDRYPHPVLFIAGLPKSGTTWLEKMVADFRGYGSLLIPDVAGYELRTGGSHDYELPDDMFTRFDRMLVLTKMHVHGSAHNAALLHRHRIPYVVLIRDLRDVAVSYHFYVGRTPWHPHYARYAGRSVQAGLARFADELLPAYVAWVHGWQARRDPALGLLVRYEELLTDTAGQMARVANHFGLDASARTIEPIVRRHTFGRLKQSGAHDPGFFRSGTAGDWRNHFTVELEARFSAAMGDFSDRLGY